MQPPAMDLQSVLQQFHGQLGAMQMQLLRARQLVQALEAERRLRRDGRQSRFPVEFTSQFGEDLFAWGLLGQQREGFFVEAGAFDGYRYSVTYAFEAVGWGGLLVEAIPERAEQCRQRRPGSRVVHAALAGREASGETAFTVVEDQYGGMLSYSTADQPHKDSVSWARRTEVRVPVASLDELLRDHAGPIDLVVLDVEGAELAALDGFDINRYRPRVMMIEDNSQGRNPAIANFMAKFPYDLAIRLAVNNVYVRRDDAEVKERLKWMQLSGW